MRTANYSELRNNLKHYLDGVINDSEPLLVHRPGNERNRKWKLLFAT